MKIGNSADKMELDLALYSRMDGIALAELVRKGSATAKELSLIFLSAVEKINPQINAVIEVWKDRVDSLDNCPTHNGPFSGVPFLMKDVGSGEAGRLQESGSRLLEGNRVVADSFLTGLFKDAGLSLLGRTTCPEFAMGISTESAFSGITRNPWDPSKMAGGSSGGSAASVAAGIVPIAHGSDNGGSIRIPASACGLVGLKPSRGRVTNGPDFGEIMSGTLQEFVISRSVRDMAVMLDSVSSPAPGDPFVILQPPRPYRDELGARVENLRVAWSTDPWQPNSEVDREVADCVEKVVLRMQESGHSIVETAPRFDYEEFLKATCDIWAYGMDVGLDMVAASMGRKVSQETVEPVLLSYYEYAKALTTMDSFMAEMTLNRFRRNFGNFFEKYDILITPTLTRLPEPIGKYSKMRTDVDYLDFMRLCDETKAFCTAANVTGQPAITLPLGQSSSGLPIGVQIMSRFGNESLLIRIASWFEKVMPWSERIPPLHASR